MPQGVAIEECIQITDEESNRILAKPLVRVDGFPIPHADQRRAEEHRLDCTPEDWEYSRDLLLAALNEGGELFFWDRHHNWSSAKGYVVVRDGRVVAKMTISHCLADPPH
jgi:hypothetical protein